MFNIGDKVVLKVSDRKGRITDRAFSEKIGSYIYCVCFDDYTFKLMRTYFHEDELDLASDQALHFEFRFEQEEDVITAMLCRVDKEGNVVDTVTSACGKLFGNDAEHFARAGYYALDIMRHNLKGDNENGR